MHSLRVCCQSPNRNERDTTLLVSVELESLFLLMTPAAVFFVLEQKCVSSTSLTVAWARLQPQQKKKGNKSLLSLLSSLNIYIFTLITHLQRAKTREYHTEMLHPITDQNTSSVSSYYCNPQALYCFTCISSFYLPAANRPQKSTSSSV